MTTDLIVAETLNPLAVFSTEGGVESVLEGIKAKAAAFVPDISTEAGRKEIASFAYKIARSKTLLDDMGKGLVAEWKAKSAAVDAERKRVREELDALKDEVRLPLTEWENAEKDRIAQHEANLDLLNRQAQFDAEPDSAGIQSRMHEAAAFHASKDWQEFHFRAQTTKDAVLSDLGRRFDQLKAFEDQQAELERLRREESERKQREHEERLKQEAADKARHEAEEKARKDREQADAAAKAEQDRLAGEARAAEEREAKAKADAAAAETARADAEERAKQAELDRESPPRTRPAQMPRKRSVWPMNALSKKPRLRRRGSATRLRRNSRPNVTRRRSGRQIRRTKPRSTTRRWKLWQRLSGHF